MAHPMPKPTAIKTAEGNPGKKKLPKNEPTAGAFKQIAPPDYLPEEARAVWTELLPEFQAMGLLQGVDVAKFADYCYDIALVRKLYRDLQAETYVFAGFNKKGQQYQQANVKALLLHQARLRLQKLGVEFGDSPSARARLGKLMEDEKDDLDELLGSKPT